MYYFKYKFNISFIIYTVLYIYGLLSQNP